jgi:hypothetical protein
MAYSGVMVPGPDAPERRPSAGGDALASAAASRTEEEPPILDAEPLPRWEPERAPRRPLVRMAWVVALATDAIQWILWPLLAEGVLSPFNDVLDVVVAAVLIRLLGWHWAFLPAFLAEIIPGVDLVPTWTAAVFLATRGTRVPPRRAR